MAVSRHICLDLTLLLDITSRCLDLAGFRHICLDLTSRCLDLAFITYIWPIYGLNYMDTDCMTLAGLDTA